jgi:hypothetical protein
MANEISQLLEKARLFLAEADQHPPEQVADLCHIIGTLHREAFSAIVARQKVEIAQLTERLARAVGRAEPMTEDADRNLLQICLDVHMAQTGAYERTEAEQRADRHLLRDRLWKWRESPNIFDEAVRQLIRATLNESAGGK